MNGSAELGALAQALSVIVDRTATSADVANFEAAVAKVEQLLIAHASARVGDEIEIETLRAEHERKKTLLKQQIDILTHLHERLTGVQQLRTALSIE